MRTIQVNKRELASVQNCHIVPRFYLNKFADKERFLTVYKRNSRPVRKSTKSQASELKYFNDKDEKWLSRIETHSAQIFNSILTGRELNPNEVAIWSVFVASLFLRSRKVRNQLGPKILSGIEPEFLGPAAASKMQHELFKNGHLIPLSECEASLRRGWDEMAGNPASVHMSNFRSSVSNLANHLLVKKWHTLESAAPAFITSDSPVLTMQLTGGGYVYLGHGFAKPDVAIVLPLNPSRVFIAGPKHIDWTSPLDAGSIEVINRAVCQFADRAVFASADSSLIQRMVDEELARIVFGENAFFTSN